MSERKKVLTVEDSPNIRRLIAYNLKRAGYDVFEAGDGKAAIEVLQQVVPDLVILDVRMPEMDGFQLLELMRQYPRAARIPVIMMTALSAPTDVDRALALGVSDYLVKPLDPTVLMAKAHAALTDAPKSAPAPWSGANRRAFVRGTIHDVRMEPFPGGLGIDLCEGGLSWRTRMPPQPGEVVVLEAPELFALVAIPERSLRCRVTYVNKVALGYHRVGAALLGLTEGARDAVRRYVIAGQSRTAI